MATYAPPETRAEMEARVGVDSLEALQAERRKVVVQLAELRARYGPGGTADAQRKAHRSAIASEIADRMTRETGKKPSEAEVERLAAGDSRVQAWLDRTEREMADYFLLETQATEWTERINRDQALIRYAANEPR